MVTSRAVVQTPSSQQQQQAPQQQKHHGFGMSPNIVLWGKGSFAGRKRPCHQAMSLYTMMISLIGTQYALFGAADDLAEAFFVSKPTFLKYLAELVAYGAIIVRDEHVWGHKGHKMTHIQIVDVWKENDAYFKKAQEEGAPEKESLPKQVGVCVKPLVQLVPPPPQSGKNPSDIGKKDAEIGKSSTESVKTFYRSSDVPSTDRSKTFTDVSSLYKSSLTDGDKRGVDAREGNTQEEDTSQTENTPAPTFPSHLEPLMKQILEALKVDRDEYLEMLLEKYAPEQALNLHEIALEVRSFHKEKTTISKFRDSIVHHLKKLSQPSQAPNMQLEQGIQQQPGQRPKNVQILRSGNRYSRMEYCVTPSAEDIAHFERTHFSVSGLFPNKVTLKQEWAIYMECPELYEEYLTTLPEDQRLPLISTEEFLAL